jgi:hypothetical protein
MSKIVVTSNQHTRHLEALIRSCLLRPPFGLTLLVACKRDIGFTPRLTANRFLLQGIVVPHAPEPHVSTVSTDDVLDMAQRWLDAGHRVAIGTVVKTWGSAPRPAGSQIAVRDDGAFTGSVSGGCVEGAVIEAAQATMRDGAHRTLEFGVSDAQAWSAGLACGGRIEIFVEPVTE